MENSRLEYPALNAPIEILFASLVFGIVGGHLIGHRDIEALLENQAVRS
jgi:hypothetical protein